MTTDAERTLAAVSHLLALRRPGTRVLDACRLALGASLARVEDLARAEELRGIEMLRQRPPLA